MATQKEPSLRGTKQSVALVPKLRFKEFEGEWEQKKLGDVSSKVAYGMNSAAITFDGKHKYLRITDIDEETREFIPNPLTSPDGLIEDKFKMKLNDIVFARTGASTGKSYLYNPKDGDLYYAGFLIKVNILKANSYFIYSQTFKESYRKWVQVYSMRSGQPGLNAEEYKNLKISISQDEEQQKIANFLTAVDAKLQQLTTKKELLAQYKKGVMQQLFSQQLRFKADDGEDFADWEEKRLGEVVTRIGDGIHSTPKYDENGKYFFVNGNNLTKGKIIVNESTKKVNKSEFEKHKRDLGHNTILLSINGTIGNIAFYDDEDIVLGKSACYINLKNSINLYFTYYLYSELTGSTIKNLSLKTIRETKLKLPCFEEQQKIATYLSAIDAKIELVNMQITKTQQFKKGLLQGMFV